jgi:hypothetical protein
MDLFKPGRRLGHRPALWRRHDIFAFDDGAAKVAAEEYYLNHPARLSLKSFSLYNGGGRFVCESQAKSD